MGPSQRQQRRFARCRWGHTVRTSYRGARRDPPAGGRLERHSEPRVGGAAGGTSWLIHDRSPELIVLLHASRRQRRNRTPSGHSTVGGVIGCSGWSEQRLPIALPAFNGCVTAIP